jgi:hypothetical protein
MQNASRLRLRIYFVRDGLFGKAHQTQKDVPVHFLCEAKKPERCRTYETLTV